jgi:hypothetical protein
VALRVFDVATVQQKLVIEASSISTQHTISLRQARQISILACMQFPYVAKYIALDGESKRQGLVDSSGTSAEAGIFLQGKQTLYRVGHRNLK